MTQHAYGYVPDRHDPRDLQFTPSVDIAALPRRVDLRNEHMPEIWDQGQLGSCTAHGALAAFLYASNVAGVGDPMLSRLELYYESRRAEGTIGQDSGAQIRDVISVLGSVGCAPESEWPYDVTKFAVPPPSRIRRDAAANRAVLYSSVPCTQSHVMAALAAGTVVVDGMPVYDSMETGHAAETGLVPLPRRGERYLGGHCTAKVGYDLDLDPWDGEYPPGVWITRNSWGSGWGLDGYFYTPLAQVKLNSDAWRITVVS